MVGSTHSLGGLVGQRGASRVGSWSARALAGMGALAASVCLLDAPTAYAAPATRWVVVSADEEGAERDVTSTGLVRALAAAKVETVTDEDAARLFEDAHSMEPTTLSPREAQTLRARVDSAVMNLSLAKLDEAQRDLTYVEEVTERALEFVNRDASLSRYVVSGCIARVRLFVARSWQEQAIQEALRCRQRHLGVEPSLAYQPPAVQRAYEEARKRLAGLPNAALLVRATNDMRGCRVRINGVDMGNTPLRAPSLYPTRLRVQVECDDRPGRVHHVALRPGQNELVVDPLFESSVRTDGRLRLVVTVAERGRTIPLGHAKRAGNVLRANTVVLLSAHANDLWVDRIDMTSRPVVCTIRLPGAPSAEVWSLAAQSLRSGTSVDLRSASPRPIGPAEGVFDPSGTLARDASEGPRIALGVTMTAAGIAGVATSLVLWNARQAQWLSYASGSSAAFTSFQAIGAWPEVVAAVSAGALAGATPLWMPTDARPTVPWWSWGFGVVGVGLAATSVAFFATQGSCIDRSAGACSTQLNWAGAQLLTGALAIQLLAVPITHLARAGDPNRVLAVGAEIFPGYARTTITGSF